VHVGDDTIENRFLRGDLYSLLPGLPDGATIKQTFEQAMSGDASAVPSLISLLHHPTPQVAQWAASILGRFGSPQVSQALKAVAGDSRNLVRAGVIRGLFRMQDPAAAEFAKSGLQDTNYTVQIASLAALEGLGDSANSATLLLYIDFPKKAVGLSAIFETLAVLGDVPGSTAVVDRLVVEENNKTNDWEDRTAAALALVQLGRADLGPPVLDRIYADEAHGLVQVARHKVQKLAASQGVQVTGQGQVDSLLAAIDVDGKKPVIDPWGQPIRGVFVSAGVFNIVSNGPDRTPGTADDISTAESWSAYDARMFASLFGPPLP
jgi:hypothetical protein